MQTNHSRFRSIQHLLLAVTFIAMLCVTKVVLSQDTASVLRTFQLSEGWYYLENSRKISVSLPASVPDDGSGFLTLYHDSLPDETAGKYLTTKGGIYKFQAALDGSLLYEYREEGFRRNPQMRSKISCFFTLPSNLENKTLALTYTDDGSGTYEIAPVTIVEENSVLLYFFVNNLFSIAIVALMYLLSLLSIWCFFYLERRNLPEKRFINVGFFLLICGTWCLTDASITQLCCNMSSTVCYISFFCFMLFAIPMIYFVKSTGNMAKYRIIDGIICAFYINTLVQIILNRFLGIELVDMLFITHLLLVTGIGILIGLLIREYRLEKSRELLTLFIAFGMIALGGLLALLLYWLLDFPYYQEIYECGILVFIVLLLRRIILSTVENAQVKTEMRVYMRLSKEDGLTSLPNRRAFDEHTAKLEGRSDHAENAALIFLDINNLKEINDTYGHNAGDELIIAVARCLQSVFSENAVCYRIGGDEFCVIVTRLTESEEAWNSRLDNAIRQYNQTHRYPLSLARGCSFLLDDNGRAKAISDWKYEADQKMYKNKVLDKLKRNGRMDDWLDLEKLIKE